MVGKRRKPWEPSLQDFAAVFREQNPWGETGVVPGVLAPPTERPIAGALASRLAIDEPHRLQVILGPRRVGKSTAMYQAVQHLLARGVPARRLLWLRLDHPLLLRYDLGALVRSAIQTSGATSERPLFLFLDEITYAREWDLWLKTFFDERWPVRLVGTSSATAALRQRQFESGVGRWEEQYLSPYLFGEYLALLGRDAPLPIADDLSSSLLAAIADEPPSLDLGDLRRRFVLTGGFPELLIGAGRLAESEDSLVLASQRALRTDAVERAIYKDIPQSFGAIDPMMLERLLYTLAGQVAAVLSPTTLCQAIGGLTQPTFDKYLSYLERAFLVFTLPNYGGSEAGVQRRGRKLYFIDGAVRNAALQRGAAPLHDPDEVGLLVENLVAAHLHALGQEAGVRLYHWRDKSAEVDLVYDHPERPLAVEATVSRKHGRAGLRALVERYPRFAGRCWVVSENPRRVAPAASPDGIGSVPMDLFLRVVSAQASSALLRRVGGAVG